MTWVVIGMSTIGKLGAAMSFASLFPYTTELFPTVIRNTVLGFVSTCGRIGTLIAPQLALLVSCQLAAAWRDLPIKIPGAAAGIVCDEHIDHGGKHTKHTS